MKALSFLVPVLNLLRHFGFIYRGIGLVIAFFIVSDNGKDLMFLSTSKGAEPMTIEQLTALPPGEIPRYLKLQNLVLLSDMYVASQREGSDEILDASYPVYSAEQMSQLDTNDFDPSNLTAHVLIKDKDFDPEAMSFFENVDGMYDNESVDEVRGILVANGVKVSENAVLIVKETPPDYSSSLLYTILGLLFGLLVLLTFVPNSVFGVVDAPEPETQE